MKRRSNMAPVSAQLRSRVGNRFGALPGVDGRSAQARRFRELCADLAGDFSTELDNAQIELIRVAAIALFTSEIAAAHIANGGHIDFNQICRSANAASRALSALARTRTQKPAPAPRASINARLAAIAEEASR